MATIYKQLVDASTAGDLKTVSYLVENVYPSIDDPHEQLLFEMNMKTALNYASINGRLEIVKYFLKNGIYGEDALILVSRQGNLEIVKSLYEFKSNTIPDDAIYEASKNDHLDVVEYLLLNKGNPKEVSFTFVKKYYSPTTPDNVLRLYDLHTNCVDITKLNGITQHDIDTLADKFALIEETLKIISQSKDITNIVKKILHKI